MKKIQSREYMIKLEELIDEKLDELEKQIENVRKIGYH